MLVFELELDKVGLLARPWMLSRIVDLKKSGVSTSAFFAASRSFLLSASKMAFAALACLVSSGVIGAVERGMAGVAASTGG